jgi:hypothetical protein
MSAKQAKIQLKSQTELSDSIPIFIQLEMTDAEVAIYTLLYCDIPARINQPKIIESASNCFDLDEVANQIEEQVSGWLNQDNIKRFKEYFRGYTFMGKEECRLYNPIRGHEYEIVIKGKTSSQLWMMLKKMIKTTDLNEIIQFVCLHPHTQIALLEEIAGCSVPSVINGSSVPLHIQKYRYLLTCTEQLLKLGCKLSVDMNKVQLDTRTVSNLISFPQMAILDDSELQALFNLLKKLVLDAAKRLDYFYKIIKIQLTTTVLTLNITSINDLENLCRQKKTRRPA